MEYITKPVTRNLWTYVLFFLKISKMKWDIKGEGERNIEGQIGWLCGILIFKNESK